MPNQPITPAQAKAHELLTLNPHCAPPSKGRRKYLKRISGLIIAAYNEGHANAMEATGDLLADLQAIRLDIDRLNVQVDEAKRLVINLTNGTTQ